MQKVKVYLIRKVLVRKNIGIQNVEALAKTEPTTRDKKLSIILLTEIYN